MPVLSEQDMRVLRFERSTWRTVGAKEHAIAETAPRSSSSQPRLIAFRDLHRPQLKLLQSCWDAKMIFNQLPQTY